MSKGLARFMDVSMASVHRETGAPFKVLAIFAQPLNALQFCEVLIENPSFDPDCVPVH